MKIFLSILSIIIFSSCYLLQNTNENVDEATPVSSSAALNNKVKQKETLILAGAKVALLATGFTFTEGPTPDKNGNIYFSDIPNSKIYLWSLERGLSIYYENSKGTNGLLFDKKNNLLMCQHEARSLSYLDQKGQLHVLADSYGGKKLNSPNDLWIDPKGGVYFTDPRYGNSENLEQDGEHVYYLSPDKKKLTRIIDDMVRPNGIIGTPDGSTLYVSDQAENKTYRYNILADGTLYSKTMFIHHGSDGVTLDEHNNLYITTEDVKIYSSEGEFLESINLPERPSNLCFGGKNGKTLFITARKSLYSIEMQVGAAKNNSR